MAEVGGNPSCLSARKWATERWQCNGATHSVAHYGGSDIFFTHFPGAARAYGSLAPGYDSAAPGGA